MRVIGVDLGGTKVQSVVVDGDVLAHTSTGGDVDPAALVLAEDRRPTPRGEGRDGVLDAVIASVEVLGLRDVAAVGVGVPGPVDSVRGRVLRAPNLAGFDVAVDVGPLLRERLGVDVLVDNDVNVAVLGEHRLGAARNCDDVLGVWCGTGIGGGLVLGGELRRGPHGYAGELGHMVVKIDGRKPPEGIEGSLEAYAGRASMEGRARKRIAAGHKSKLLEIADAKDKDHFTSSVFRKAVKEGDRLAVELIDGAVEGLGAGIASAVNLLDLERVVLGGGVADSFGEDFVDRVGREMRRSLIVPESAPAVVAASLGDYGGALGSAALALASL
ncbi:MAG: ROK family protein [Acidimicrobiia bacterium]